MATINSDPSAQRPRTIPWFGARKVARALLAEVQKLHTQRDAARNQLTRIGAMANELVAEVRHLRAQNETTRKQLAILGALPLVELEARRLQLETEIGAQTARLAREHADAVTALTALKKQYTEVRRSIVETEDLALLQEVGIYKYRHPLTDAVAYEKQLAGIDDDIKAMTRKDGGAVLATNEWTVNGSAAEGRVMVRDFSKLMLRAFNAEADTLVRSLKPYKLEAAVDRLNKVAETIERLGKTMKIRISNSYLQLRMRELELTADFLACTRFC
jgi:hypothetical protein